jgi:hypothetical protein
MSVRSALRAGRPLSLNKIPRTHFCQRSNRPQGQSVAGRITSIEKSNDLIGNITDDTQDLSQVTYNVALINIHINSTQLIVFCGLCTTEIWLWNDLESMFVPFRWKWKGDQWKGGTVKVYNRVWRDKRQRMMITKTILKQAALHFSVSLRFLSFNIHANSNK